MNVSRSIVSRHLNGKKDCPDVDRFIIEDIIIDNGKDYRSKDFAGGRKIQVDEQDTTCMLEELNVNVHFAETKRKRTSN